MDNLITRVPNQAELVATTITRMVETARTSGRGRIELESYLAAMTRVPVESLSLGDMVAAFGRRGAFDLLKRVAQKAEQNHSPAAQAWDWTAKNLA